MTARSIRRAQERKARKEEVRKARKELASEARNEHEAPKETPCEATPLAREAEDIPAIPSVEAVIADSTSNTFRHLEQPQTSETLFTPTAAPSLLNAPKPISPRKLAANRANAQLSTGPTTAEGRATSCLNAVKTALTGRTVLLPADDAAAYEQHVLAYTKELRPFTQRECDLVQSIADTAWRLKRIPALEMAIYAQGRIQFAASFDDQDRTLRPSMIELQTFLTYEKQLRNLQLQEARLARRYEKDTAELRKMQQERDQRDQVDLDVASKLYLAAQHDHQPFNSADYGFEFSIEDLESYLQGVRAANISRASMIKDRDAALRTLKSHSQAA